MSKIRMACVAIAVAATAGCAATPAEQPMSLTYTWEAENRVARVQFEDNHVGCTQASRTVASYETCMVDRGYTRSEP